MAEQNSPRPHRSATTQRAPWEDIDVDALYEATEPAQVAILTDPRRVQFLLPFLGRERTVSEAARQLDITGNALLYRVRKMLEAGLLQVVAERPRAGRAIKVYRSSHDGYRVPMSAMHYDDLRHRVDTYGRRMFSDLAGAYTAALLDAPHHDRVITLNRDGDVWTTDLLPATTRQGRPVVMTDIIARLDRQQAELVERRLREALEEALSSDGPASSAGTKEPYFVMGAMVPMPR